MSTGRNFVATSAEGMQIGTRRVAWTVAPAAPLALVLALLLSLLLPVGYFTLQGWRSLEDEAQRGLTRDLDQLADTLAVALREPVADPAGRRSVATVQAMFSDPRLVAVTAVRTGEDKPVLDLFRSVAADAPTLQRQRRLLDAGPRLDASR
jgi:hypothetical protein